MNLAGLSRLQEERGARWAATNLPLMTAEDAARYVDDLAFVVLFGDEGASFPSLREAGRDDDAPMLPAGWGADLERVWTWKDELPEQGRAWCGRFIAGRQSLLSPELLTLLYEFPGEPDDFYLAPLSGTAQRIAEQLLDHGPTSMRAIRQIHSLNARSSQKVLNELGQCLIVTNYGTVRDGPGWPSCIVELTARAFDVASDRPLDDRRRDAVKKFLATMVEASAAEVSKAFRWPRNDSSAVLTELVRIGHSRHAPDKRYRLIDPQETDAAV